MTGELCDVANNKHHYDIFKTVKSECPITYEEKLNYYSAVVEYQDLNGWLKAITSKWLVEQIDLLTLQAQFEKQNEGFYGVKILNSNGIIMDFAYIHHTKHLGEYHFTVFSGIFRRWEESKHCRPIADLVTWNDVTLEKARLYFFYREMKKIKEISNRVLGATCPALKYDEL